MPCESSRRLTDVHMTEVALSHGKVVIRYDVARGPDHTVEKDGITVSGRGLLAVLGEVLIQAGGQSERVLAMLEPVLFEVYDAIDQLPASTRGDLVFRDAADRCHEQMLTPIWRDLTSQGRDQLALEFMLWSTRSIAQWENAVSPSRHLHKGVPMYFGAVSALRMRDLDLGCLLLEAGELVDRETYSFAGKPGGETNRPGTLTFRMSENPGNFLQLDILRLRDTLRKQLSDFATSSGAPARDPLLIEDLDRCFFDNPDLRTGTKLLFASLFWTMFLIDNNSLSGVPRGGQLIPRRQGELLFGLLTAMDRVLREVNLPQMDRDLYEVIQRIVAADVPGGSSPTAVKLILDGIVQGHGNDIDRCLAFWDQNKTGGPGGNLPWYVGWLESGRLLRNKFAHLLDAPSQVHSKWQDIERTVRFALFSSLWLLKRKAGPVPTPSSQPTASLGGPQNPMTAMDQWVAGSGVATMTHFVTGPQNTSSSS